MSDTIRSMLVTSRIQTLTTSQPWTISLTQSSISVQSGCTIPQIKHLYIRQSLCHGTREHVEPWQIMLLEAGMHHKGKNSSKK